MLDYIRDNGISIEVFGGKLRAVPPEKARPMMPDFVANRAVLMKLAQGYLTDWQGIRREIRIECRTIGACWRCEGWTPEMDEKGERTGLCVSRKQKEIQLKDEVKMHVNTGKAVSDRGYK